MKKYLTNFCNILSIFQKMSIVYNLHESNEKTVLLDTQTQQTFQSEPVSVQTVTLGEL